MAVSADQWVRCLSSFLFTDSLRNLTFEVRVDEMLSESFIVARGLRRGCILSSLLCSLYVNSLVEKVRGVWVGVECRGWMVAVLLMHIMRCYSQRMKSRSRRA